MGLIMKAKELSDYENALLENNERRMINMYGKNNIIEAIERKKRWKEINSLKNTWKIDKIDLYNACVKLCWFDNKFQKFIKRISRGLRNAIKRFIYKLARG
jgi:hypothetical protein